MKKIPYKQAVEYFYNQLPVFHRQGAAAYKADMENTNKLMKMLNHPENKFKSIHVAGTNGKGSSSHLLSSILMENGLRVGLHTSPHIKDIRERIVVNGKPCGKIFITGFLEKYQTQLEEIKPSFFEIMVAMAFDYFSKKTDIAVVEVGMGGRLDSTNVITPEVCLITNISYDHTQFLGNTLPEIAEQKAGIIKRDVPVVISQTQPEVQQVFIDKAERMNAPIYFADQIFKVENIRWDDSCQIMDIYKEDKIYLKDLRCPLLGKYQQKNILGVLQVVEVLNASGKYHISLGDVRRAVERVQENCPILGRWQTLSKDPLTICDTGHNVAGLTEVMQQLESIPKKKLNFVIGVVNDKDIEAEIQLLPKDAEYYLCKADIPRGLDVMTLADKFKAAGLQYSTYPSVKAALKAAQTNALSTGAMVFVGGSTYTVAEIL